MKKKLKKVSECFDSFWRREAHPLRAVTCNNLLLVKSERERDDGIRDGMEKPN